MAWVPVADCKSTHVLRHYRPSDPDYFGGLGGIGGGGGRQVAGGELTPDAAKTACAR